MLRLSVGLSSPALGAWLTGVADPFLRGRARDRFANEGDDAVGKWVPLAPATQQIRMSQGFGSAHPINKRTGALEDYILSTPSKVTPFPGFASMRFPGIGTSGELNKKLTTAQFGKPAESGRRAVPRRPVLGLSPTDYAFMLGGLKMYVGGLLR